MAYSGTHETSRFGERDSGNALVVEIVGPGETPNIYPVKTGRLKWQILESEIVAPGDLKKMREDLERIKEPESLLLDLRLKGMLCSEEKEDLLHIENIITSRFLFGRIDNSQLLPSPKDTQWIDLLPAGILQETAERLQQKALSGGREAQIASRALLELYTIVGKEIR